ncbi:MAG: hypothetical protein AAGJ83_01065 [Planctomycetota bacterium]
MKTVFLMLWIGIGVTVTSSLMVGHVVALPTPEEGETISVETLGFQPTGSSDFESKPAMAIHVFYGNCPCSQRVLDKLLGRTAMQPIQERIVFVGKPDPREDQASKRGYQVERVTRDELRSRYGVQAAPLLMLVDDRGRILYSGGYTDRKQGPSIQDVAIIESILDGVATESLPVFGCAVSQELQQVIDPFGLKYVDAEAEQ